jgi:hypothetical protein
MSNYAYGICDRVSNKKVGAPTSHKTIGLQCYFRSSLGIRNSFYEEFRSMFDKNPQIQYENIIRRLENQSGWGRVFKSTIGNEKLHGLTMTMELQ